MRAKTSNAISIRFYQSNKRLKSTKVVQMRTITQGDNLYLRGQLVLKTLKGLNGLNGPKQTKAD